MIRPSPEIEAIVRRMLSLSSQRKVRESASLFSGSPAATYIGSAADEIWTGDFLHAVFASMPEDLRPFAYEGIEISAWENGDTGWALWSATMDTLDGGRRVPFRGTVVFVMENATWRIVQTHNSTPVSNEQAMGYEPGDFDDLMREAAKVMDGAGQTGRMTVMFTDIADSSAITQSMGDVRWTRLVQRHVAVISDLVAAQDGRLVKSLGDGTMSIFPSADAGLRAALAIQAAQARGTDDPQLHVRIGIHTGNVVEARDDFFGTVVNKAARIAAVAQPDEIRVSDETRLLAAEIGAFRFDAPAIVPLKGLDGEHLIHRLEWRQ